MAIVMEIPHENTRLEELELYKAGDGRYYLCAEYTKEYDRKISRFIIPKIYLPTSSYPSIERTYYDSWNRPVEVGIDLGFGVLTAKKGDVFDPREDRSVDAFDVFYAEYTMENKTKKMTLSEIEKELGHKIELISEEE